MYFSISFRDRIIPQRISVKAENYKTESNKKERPTDTSVSDNCMNHIAYSFSFQVSELEITMCWISINFILIEYLHNELCSQINQKFHSITYIHIR